MKSQVTLTKNELLGYIRPISSNFSSYGVAPVEIPSLFSDKLTSWIDKGYSAEMHYMSKHGTKRYRPKELEPWVTTILIFTLPYLHKKEELSKVISDSNRGYISRYALGRDYHKVLKKELNQITNSLTKTIGEFKSRIFVDSAPVMERALALTSGIGWFGKNSMLISKDSGSFNFIGVIYTDINCTELNNSHLKSHCGNCFKCGESCPTGAIVAPYTVDSNKCISYLTIENKGIIPLELRPLIGNRIYGCDDCQICCPWNRFAKYTNLSDFTPRNNLDTVSLLELFEWTEEEFSRRMEGSPIRRIGYDSWQRNIAVALGNSKEKGDKLLDVISALEKQSKNSSTLVTEHIDWALEILRKTLI
jgi:epoxyqueuosine reductase